MRRIKFNKYFLFYFVFYAYKKLLSPILGNNCRFTPPCSNYFIESIEKNGVIKGLLLTFARIIHCNPLYQGGVDQPRQSVTIKECIYLIFKYKNNEIS